MKKLLTLLLSVSMVATLLVGCGGAKTEEAPATENTEAATTETTEEGLKIAIVSSPSGVDDGSFNQNNYEGILAFIEANPGATVTPVKEETGDVAAAVQAVADIVADYDAIVCCGFQFAGIAAIAEENPDVSFILVDANPTDAEGNEVVIEANTVVMAVGSKKNVFDVEGVTVPVYYAGDCDGERTADIANAIRGGYKAANEI